MIETRYTFSMADKSQGFFIALIIGAWILLLFFGFIESVGKTFQKPEKLNEKSASSLLQERKEQTRILAEEQKRLMEDRQQRLRDMQQMHR